MINKVAPLKIEKLQTFYIFVTNKDIFIEFELEESIRDVRCTWHNFSRKSEKLLAAVSFYVYDARLIDISLLRNN